MQFAISHKAIRVGILGAASVGVIIRDNCWMSSLLGQHLGISWLNFGRLRDDLLLAHRILIFNVFVELDAKVVNYIMVFFGSHTHNCKTLLSRLQHTFNKGNRCAHALAKPESHVNPSLLSYARFSQDFYVVYFNISDFMDLINTHLYHTRFN